MSRMQNVESDITLAFSTPVLSRVFDGCHGLNRRLREVVLAREAEFPSTDKSNVGGWHSSEDLFSWPHPAVAELLARLGSAVKSINDYAIGPQNESGEVDLVAWANVLRDGDYHQPHFHPNCDWSGVYYVATGSSRSDQGRGGRIDLLDPRAGVGMLKTPGNIFLGTLQFVPRPGMVLVFPGYLVHHVHPHSGGGERISVAFNARMLTMVPRGKGRKLKWW